MATGGPDGPGRGQVGKDMAAARLGAASILLPVIYLKVGGKETAGMLRGGKRTIRRKNYRLQVQLTQ